MDIDFHFREVANAEDAKKLVAQEDLKFVMVEDAGGLVTAIFEKTAEHARVAFRLLNARNLAVKCFKGAGRIGPDGPYYDSTTCIRSFRGDSPKDPEEAQRLLEELRVKLMEIGVLERHA